VSGGNGSAAAVSGGQALFGPALALVLALTGPVLLTLAQGPAGPWVRALDGLAWTALALFPWLVLVGWPRRALPVGCRRAGLAAVLVPWAAVLPAWVVNARLDLAAGAELSALVVLLGHGPALGLVLALAAEAAARRGERVAQVHGALWLLVLGGLPLLAVALDWAGRPGGGEVPVWVLRASELSVLAWCLEQAREGRLLGGAAVAVPQLAWLAALALLGVALGTPRGEQESGMQAGGEARS
jgi:hypothetical protein